MEDNKVYLTAKELGKLVFKKEYFRNLSNERASNVMEFTKSKFNDKYLFENEFKDDYLLSEVFKIISASPIFVASNYFLLVDLFNTIKPSTNIEKEIFLDLCKILIKFHDLDISFKLIKDYYNSYTNKDYFYRSIVVIIDETIKLINQRHYEYVIRFLISIRQNFINEYDYYTYAVSAFLILNDEECIFEDKIFKTLNIKNPKIFKTLNIKNPKIYKGILKASLNNKNTQVKFIEELYSLSNQTIDKNQLLELRKNLETTKTIDNINKVQEESIKVLSNFVYFIDVLDRIENFNKKDKTDYKSKYEEIIASDIYNDSPHHNKFDLILKNVLLNKNILLVGRRDSSKYFCISQICEILNKELFKIDIDKLNDYTFLSKILNRDTIIVIIYKENNLDKINNFLDMIKDNALVIDNKKVEVNPNLNILIMSEEDIELNNVTKIELKFDSELYDNSFIYSSERKTKVKVNRYGRL